MSDCTCTNCIFIDGGRRYCYDCEKYTKMPPKEEIERRIEELSEPAKSKAELYDRTGLLASGYYSSYPNHLPRLIKEMKNDQEI